MLGTGLEWRGTVCSLQVVPVPVDDLLSKEYAKKRRAELYLPNKVGVIPILMLTRFLHRLKNCMERR